MRYCLFCLLFSFSLIAQDAPQEIRVRLFTENALSPIYLSQISTDGSLTHSYIKDIEKILAYDFNYNGKTQVTPKSEAKDAALKSGSFSEVGASYAISFAVKEKNLISKTYNAFTGKTFLFPPIPLTGILAEDRKALHKLSDSAHKIFFQTEGIASTKILYSFQNKTAEGSWTSEIAECDWDGENVKMLTRENSYCITPVSIQKDSNFNKNLFLYVSYKTGQPKIFLSSKDTGKGKKVVDIRGNQMLPAISKQRDRLAFICDASGRTDLFVQSIQPETGKVGTPMQLYSYPRSTQASPVFSPDGKKIAFVSDKDGSPRIYTIPSTPQPKRPPAHLLTKANKENSSPSWSPDGKKMAYSAKTEGIRQIWIYDFTLEEETQLTFGPGNKENPSWASDNLHIVFNSTDGNYSDLYIVNLNQPSAIKITNGLGKKHYPSWETR